MIIISILQEKFQRPQRQISPYQPTTNSNMTTIISNIFFKISYRDLHRKTAFHSRLFLGFPKDGINMIWNEKVLIKPLISKINILREFLLCPPPTLLLVRFKPWQQCWRWWQVPQIFVLPRDSTPLRFSSCVIVTVATMLMMMMMITTTMLMTTLPSLFCLANQQRIPSPLGPAPITQTFPTIAWKIAAIHFWDWVGVVPLGILQQKVRILWWFFRPYFLAFSITDWNTH